MAASPVPNRSRLPGTRESITHKFDIAGHKGYVTVSVYPDGRPGEMFVSISKQGSTIHGLLDGIAILTSLSLQHGVPLRTICDKFIGMRFEPSGWSQNQDIGHAKSIFDYIFRWMEIRFLGVPIVKEVREVIETPNEYPPVVAEDAPFCTNCGSIMQRAGSCYSCNQCGSTSGCG